METITTPPAGVIVKSDSTGRTRFTSQHKAEVLAAYQRSSQSAPVFAKQCGIKYPTFAAWIAARKTADHTTTRTATPAFFGYVKIDEPPVRWSRARAIAEAEWREES